VTEHQLFLLLAEIVVLVVAARLGGELALRLGVAEVVGELVMGVLIGPSLFGKLWPGGFRALFPADPVQRSFLELIGWIGVIFLVLLSGFETRLGVLRTSGRAVIAGWLGGFLLPFALGLALGWVVPEALIGPGVQRPVFAVFLGTAMAISAIPVIARILMDLQLLGTRIGTLILSTAIADDTVGWVVLAVVAGLAADHQVHGGTVAVALVGTGAFVILAFTVGQWLVRKAFGLVSTMRIPFAQATLILSVVFIGGAITEAIHVHLVLGSFVAGILIARTNWKLRDRAVVESIRPIGLGFFVPFFFAYTGIKMDLTTLTGSALWVAVAAVVLACAGKLVGGAAGARAGGLAGWEALAVGAGRNARGAMELVIAAIGLSIGVLTLPMYSIIVLIAVLTTLMAAPLVRYFAFRSGSLPAEVTVERPTAGDDRSVSGV
jgi:Kef-type K+ transport system membrane component KefB